MPEDNTPRFGRQCHFGALVKLVMILDDAGKDAVLIVVVDQAQFMTTGNDPHTAVFQGGVIDGDGAGQNLSAAVGEEGKVLMPGGGKALARRFHHQL